MRELSAVMGELPLPVAEVAMIADHTAKWAYDCSMIGHDYKYDSIFCRLHEELYKRNVLADIIPTDRELNDYKLVILPSCVIMEDQFAAKLRDYVAGGGVVLAWGQLGMRDSNDNFLAERGPQHLQNLFGAMITGGMYLHSQMAPDESWGKLKRIFALKIEGDLGGDAAVGTAGLWAGDIETTSGKALLKYTDDAYRGQAAVIENHYGNGTAVYVAAAELDQELSGKVFDYLLKKAGAGFSHGLPEYVEVVARGPITFVINHRDEEVLFDTGRHIEAIRGTAEHGIIRLKPYDVCIYRNALF